MKCSPFVRQYGIIEIYQLKSLTKGGIFMPKGKPNKRYTPEFKIKVEVEEDLITEAQRLRAENAYLKKLNALVAERVRQEKKHK